jgi:hypothetical protein
MVRIVTFGAGRDSATRYIDRFVIPSYDPGKLWQDRAVRAFEEGIRYDNPARFTRRRAAVEVDVDGVTLPEDAKLLLLHMPAGRDPRRWEIPRFGGDRVSAEDLAGLDRLNFQR